MITEDKLSNVLGHTKTIIDHQREMKKARGENFNVFSVLSVERSENKTHSAFLAELLNPKGSHLKGNTFLSLLLDVLNLEKLKFDYTTAQVKPEFYIGPRDEKSKTGGRIDIYIWDNNGDSISIENKIYAGDQEAQIERYCNYKKGRNAVLYLTLKGTEPTPASKGELESGTDFHNISYRDHIHDWLDKCIKESAEQPILRESIKQYKILIQKLTSTMDKTHQQDLNRIMLKHVRESTYIAENFAKVTAEIKERVRQDVIQKLKEKLDEKYVVQSGDKADKWFSQIWIKLMGFEKAKLHFGIESFSGNGNFKGNLFIGVFNQSGKKNRYLEKSDRHSNHWVNVKELTNYGSFKMNLRSPDTLEALSEDKLFQEGFADHIVNEVEVYLEQHVEQLQAFLKSETLVSAN